MLLEQKLFRPCLEVCLQVIDQRRVLVGSSAKAYLRAAKACIALDQRSQAVQLCEEGMKLCPDFGELDTRKRDLESDLTMQ